MEVQNPPNNEVYHSYQFYIRKQEDGESFESFFTDIFQLGKQCHFKNYEKFTLEKIIRDKIIYGLHDPKTRENIFSKGYTELCDVIKYCRTSEKKKSRENKPIQVSDKGNGINETERIGNGSRNIPDVGEVSFNDSGPAVPGGQTTAVVEENHREGEILERGEVAVSKKGSKLKNIKPEGSRTNSSSCDVNRNRSNFMNYSDSDEKNSSLDDNDNDDDYIPRKSESEDEKDCEIISIDSAGSSESSGSQTRRSVGRRRNIRSRSSSSSNSNSSSDEHPATKSKRTTRNRIDEISVDELNHSLNSSLYQSREFHKCEKCEEIFSQKFKLLEHIKTCEGNLKSENNRSNGHFKCSTCPKEFTSRKELDVHELIHPYKTEYKCDDCDKVFYSNSLLKRHELERHKKGVLKFYNCNYCSEQFSYKIALKRHIDRVHKQSPQSRKRPRIEN